MLAGTFARNLTALHGFRQIMAGPLQVANRAAWPFHALVFIWHAGSFKKGVMRRPVFSDNSRSFHANAIAAAGFWKARRQAAGRDRGSTHAVEEHLSLARAGDFLGARRPGPEAVGGGLDHPDPGGGIFHGKGLKP